MGKRRHKKRGKKLAIPKWQNPKDAQRFLKSGHFITNVKTQALIQREKRPYKLFPPDCIRTNLQRCQNVSEQCQLVTNMLGLNEWDMQKINKVCDDVVRLLRLYYPDCHIYLYGSSVTGFGSKRCGIDILFEPSPQYFQLMFDNAVYKPDEHYYVTFGLADLKQGRVTMDELITMPPPCQVQVIQKIFKSEGNHGVFSTPPKVMNFLRVLHLESELRCGIACSDKLVLCTTMLLQFYSRMDSRVRPLMLILCYWGKQIQFIKERSFTSYAFTLLVIFFLQTTQPQVLPSVNVLKSKATFERIEAGWNCAFCDDLNEYEPSKNEESVGHLLLSFFEFLDRFDFSGVVSPLYGYPLNRNAFKDLDQQGDRNFVDCPICIQDPIECCRNVTAAVTLNKLKHLKKAANIVIPVLRQSVNASRECLNWGIISLFHVNQARPLIQIPNEYSLSNCQSPSHVFTLSFKYDLKDCLSNWEKNNSWWILKIGETLVDAFRNSLSLQTEIRNRCDEYLLVVETEAKANTLGEIPGSNNSVSSASSNSVFGGSESTQKIMVKTEKDAHVSYPTLEFSTPSHSQSNHSSCEYDMFRKVKVEPPDFSPGCDNMSQNIKSEPTNSCREFALPSSSEPKVLISLQSVITCDAWHERINMKDIKDQKSVSSLFQPVCFSCCCWYYRSQCNDKLVFVLTPVGTFVKFKKYTSFFTTFLTKKLNCALNK